MDASGEAFRAMSAEVFSEGDAVGNVRANPPHSEEPGLGKVVERGAAGRGGGGNHHHDFRRTFRHVGREGDSQLPIRGISAFRWTVITIVSRSSIALQVRGSTA
jgi:hypothetical protein